MTSRYDLAKGEKMRVDFTDRLKALRTILDEASKKAYEVTGLHPLGKSQCEEIEHLCRTAMILAKDCKIEPLPKESES